MCDTVKFEIRFMRSKCGLVIDAIPITKEATEFISLIISNIGEKNRDYIPIILQSLPNEIVNEQMINGVVKYELNVCIDEINVETYFNILNFYKG